MGHGSCGHLLRMELMAECLGSSLLFSAGENFIDIFCWR